MFSRLGLLWTTIFVLSLAGCSNSVAPTLEPGSGISASPITLLAVDGLEWDVILPMIAEGRLPNIKRMMDEGAFGLFPTLLPTFSPVVWTSVATGKMPEKHGIIHFAYRSEDGLTLFNSSNRKTKAIWNILTDYGKRVSTVGWWMTYPVEEINGIMVAQTNTVERLDTDAGKNVRKGSLLKGVPGQVHPEGRQNEMIEILAEIEEELPTLTEQIFGSFRYPLSPLDERLWDNCQWAFRADATYRRIAIQLAREKPPADLTLIYLGGPDVVGHRFWRYKYARLYRHRPTTRQVANFGRMIESYYEYTDATLGELLATDPDSNGTVLVISDHGMQPINTGARFDPEDIPKDVNSADHQEGPPGVFLAIGPFIQPTSVEKPLSQLERKDLPVIGSVLDITPTLLAMLRIPIASDMDGKILDHLFREGFEIGTQPPVTDTHDTRKFLSGRQELPMPHPDQQERLEQLRNLGYIADDGGE